MNKIKSFSQHPFIRGTFIFTSATFLVNVLSYVFNLFIARGMSLANYGEYSSAISYLSLFAVPFGTLSLIIIKKIGNTLRSDRSQFLQNFEAKFFQYIHSHGLLLIIISFASVYLMTNRGNLHLTTSVFVILAVWLTVYFTFYSSALFALKEFWQSGSIQVLQGVVKVVLGAVIIFAIPRLDLLYGVLLLTTVLGIYLSKQALPHDSSIQAEKTTLPNFWKLIRNPEYYIPLVTSLGTIGIINIDLILVKKFFPSDEVGFYAAISLLGKIILYIATPLTAVAFTFFTGNENSSQKTKIFWLTMCGLIAMGVVSVFGYTVFADVIIAIIFGEKFISIQTMLTLAAIFGSSYSLMTLFSQYLVSIQSKFAMFSSIGFFAQVVLIYQFHDSFQQILGINIFCTIALFFIYLLAWGHHSGVLYSKLNREKK